MDKQYKELLDLYAKVKCERDELDKALEWHRDELSSLGGKLAIQGKHIQQLEEKLKTVR